MCYWIRNWRKRRREQNSNWFGQFMQMHWIRMIECMCYCMMECGQHIVILIDETRTKKVIDLEYRAVVLWGYPTKATPHPLFKMHLIQSELWCTSSSSDCKAIPATQSQIQNKYANTTHYTTTTRRNANELEDTGWMQIHSPNTE